jgi:hypothetical protein
MPYSTEAVKRVVGPGGSARVSFHDAWPLSQSEVLYWTGGFSPTRGDVDFRPIGVEIKYTSSF